jgi:predicted transcriptional regulator
MEIKTTRKQLGVSQSELAAVLGPGWSQARLSLLERGLIPVSTKEREVIFAALDRVGTLRHEIRTIIEEAGSINLAAHCVDIRERAQGLRLSLNL